MQLAPKRFLKLACAAGVVLFLVTVSACSASPEVTPSRLTAAEFAAQGNSICADLTEQLDDIFSIESGESGSTREQYRLANDASDASFEVLFELRPPVELEADFETLKEIQAERAEAAASRLPEPDLAERLGPPWDEATTRLGLDQCR